MGLSSEALLAILYDLSQAAAGETQTGPVLRRVLQRLLYHTSFPVGVALRHTSPEGDPEAWVELGPALGDRALLQRVGAPVRLPPGTLEGRIALRFPSPLAGLLGARPAQRASLELPVDPKWTLILLGPEPPSSTMPWGAVFQPAMANLSRTLGLCGENERLAAELRHELAVRTQAEQAAREAMEQAEAANRAKSAFLANMSHEIRTPMNAILGFTHLLQRETTDPRQREKLHKIGAAAEHLLGLLNDVLDLSKIEAGRLVLEGGRVDLGSAFDHVVSMISERAREKGVSLVQELDPALHGLHLIGDALRFKQVLLNLVTNAVKFTEDGEVRLRARLRSAGAESALVEVVVEDTGIGIPPDVLPRLFTAFEQGRPETAREHGGTGLGLAICRRLVALMGGEIGVESTLGEGSRFTFSARFGRAAAPSGARPVSGRGVRPQARVMVVDDNPINRDMAVELLESFGLLVIAAGSGREAIQRFAEGGVELVLLDKEMPGLDGPETARVLRGLPGGAVPILAWTANTFEFDRRQCLAAGMDDFIPKPIEPRLLHAVLAHWLPAETEAAPAPVPPPPRARVDATCQGGWCPSTLALDTAVAVLGGSRERALHYLGRFPQDHGADVARLRALRDGGDRRAAAAAAQELSGVAVGLGLEALARAAGRVAAALARPPVGADDPLDQSLMAELDTAMKDALTAIHGTLEAGAPGAALREGLEAELDLLDALLEADDAHAVEVWARISAELTSWIGDRPLGPLSAAVDNFDFTSARAALRALRQR